MKPHCPGIPEKETDCVSWFFVPYFVGKLLHCCVCILTSGLDVCREPVSFLILGQAISETDRDKNSRDNLIPSFHPSILSIYPRNSNSTQPSVSNSQTVLSKTHPLSFIPPYTCVSTNPFTSRGLSGYRARRRVADSRGPVLMAGLSPNK
jgi:hypothetical protein